MNNRAQVLHQSPIRDSSICFSSSPATGEELKQYFLFLTFLLCPWQQGRGRGCPSHAGSVPLQECVLWMPDSDGPQASLLPEEIVLGVLQDLAEGGSESLVVIAEVLEKWGRSQKIENRAKISQMAKPRITTQQCSKTTQQYSKNNQSYLQTHKKIRG